MKKIVLALATTLLLPNMSFADTISGVSGSSAPNIGSGITLIDFESQSNASFSSLTLNSVTFEGVDGNLRTANDYAGLYNCMGVRCIDNNEGITTSIKFTFLTPTNGFAFNFGASDSIWVLNAYNSANELLGSVDAPVTLSSNSGDYIGLQFASSSISYATLILGTFDYIFIDNFIFFSGPSAASTLASMTTTSQAIASQFAGFAMSTNYANMNTYDCGLFDAKTVAVSLSVVGIQ